MKDFLLLLGVLCGLMLLTALVKALPPIPSAVVVAVLACISTLVISYFIRSTPDVPVRSALARWGLNLFALAVWLVLTVGIIQHFTSPPDPKISWDRDVSRRICHVAGYGMSTAIIWQISAVPRWIRRRLHRRIR